MRRFLFFTAVCILPYVASAAELSPRPEGITRREALALSVQELAKRLFGDTSGVVREVMRPSYLPPNLRGDPVLYDLKLATLPRALGAGGLCVAEVIEVTFEAPPPSERKLRPEYTRVRPAALKTANVFKLVGNAEAPAASSTCDQAGRVLPTNSTSLSQRQFFEVEGAGQAADTARMAATVLQRSMSAAKHDGIAMESLVKVSVAPCAKSSRICVSGDFLPPAGTLSPTFWRVSVEADVPNFGTGNWTVKSLSNIKVSPVSVQRD